MHRTKASPNLTDTIFVFTAIYYPNEIVLDSGATYINATQYASKGYQPSANLTANPLNDGVEYSTLKNLFMPMGGGTGGGTQTLVVTAVNENTLTCGGQVISLAFTGGTGSTNGTHALAFSGGGGSGATGTVTVASGVITGVTLTFGGSGYTSAPAVSFTGIGTGTITATISAQVTVALPWHLQASTYNGQTVALPNGTHVYAYSGTPGFATDTVATPDGSDSTWPGTIWPAYLSGSNGNTLSGTPPQWNTINVFTPPGGTGQSGVTLMDVNVAARQWLWSKPDCYAGAAGYLLVPSMPTTTNVT